MLIRACCDQVESYKKDSTVIVIPGRALLGASPESISLQSMWLNGFQVRSTLLRAPCCASA